MLNIDLHVGDELLCIEGRVVCDLDMLFIENLLHTSSTVTLTVRSSRTVFAQTQAMMDTNKYIDQLTCPPPPSQNRLTDDMIDMLIIPAPLSKYTIIIEYFSGIDIIYRYVNYTSITQ